MRKFLSAALCALILASCSDSGDASVRYVLTSDLTDQERLSQVPATVKRLLENRVLALDGVTKSVTVEQDAKGFTAVVTLSGSDMSILDTLTERITEPLTIRFMTEAPLEEADIVIAETEGYKETKLTEDHIDWMTWSAHPVLNTGEVTIVLTEEGKALRKEIFGQNVGKNIGIFVKQRPVYKLTVDENDDEQPDSVVLRNIPSPEMAQIFADDMNIGLHVTFTPVQ